MKVRKNKKNTVVALALVSALGVSYGTSLFVNTGEGPIVINAAEKSNIAGETEVLNSKSSLKYFDKNTDPADGTQAKDKWGQYTGWTRPYEEGNNEELNGTYDDKEWIEAVGTNGYKEGEGEILKPSAAYFFRGYFDASNISEIKGLKLNIEYNDAVIVYINGQQLTSFNVPGEGYKKDNRKDNMGYGSEVAQAEPFKTEVSIRDINDMLVEGQNVIAFEVHKTNENSKGYFKLNSLTLKTTEEGLPERDAVKAISLSVGAVPTELNLNWFSTASNGGQVQIAKKSEMKGNSFPVSGVKTIDAKMNKAQAEGYYANKVTISDLEENTEYVYRVGNNGEWSDVYTTKTSKKDGEYSFVFAGDPQLGSSGDLTADNDGWRNTLDIIKNNSLFADVDFVQNAGDHVEAGNSERQYDSYLSNYDGSLIYSMPFANAVGNHDYNGTTYNDHFNLPNVSGWGDSGEGKAEGDYYYIYNNMLMMVLNSNNKSTQEHENFIDDVLEKTKNNKEIKWKFVVFHHSIYSTASHASDEDILLRRETLAPMLTEKGIDVVLMGHDHVYTRSYFMDGTTPLKDESLGKNGELLHDYTDPNGVLYITANSASGSKYYEFANQLQGDYVAYKNQDHVANISKVTVTDTQMKITTYETNNLSVVDEVTINKTPETINKTDKSKLESLVKEAKTKDQSKYTEGSFAAFTTALTKAEAVLEDEKATQEEIDTAVSSLQKAMNELKLIESANDVNGPEEDTQTPPVINDSNDNINNDGNSNKNSNTNGNTETNNNKGVETGEHSNSVMAGSLAGLALLTGIFAYRKNKKNV